jgi:protein gp37
MNSAIEWCHDTFNGWIGCTKVSPGCDFCYAERDFDLRKGRVKWGAGNPRSRTSVANWKKPIAWDRQAAAAGERRRVFGGSLMDWADSEVDASWRADLFELIKDTPNLDWLMLTKRPQLIKKYVPDDWGDGYDNVWMGTSVENQEWAERRIPLLMETPAKVYWLSAEPLIGKIDLWGACDSPGSIDWVVVGGESGPQARMMEEDWALSLQDDCEAMGASFFMKQMGEKWGAAKGDKKSHKDIDKWPEELRVRDFPEPVEA